MFDLEVVGNFLRSLPVVARLLERKSDSVQPENRVHGGEKMEADDFWADLNDDYYKAYPEQWENSPFYADGPGFLKILNGVITMFDRKLRHTERIVDGAIVRAGRKIWETGRIYRVRAEPFVEPSLGEIKLVSIELKSGLDTGAATLTFEPYK